MAGFDLLSIQPHKVSRDLSGYVTYLYSVPKGGKTSLAAQAPNCLLLATERGYNAIAGIRAVDITSWSDMRKVFKELKKPEVKEVYSTLIVDTVDLAAKYCTKYICDQQGVQELGELPYGRGYSLMRAEFEDIFNSLAQMGYAIIFTSHVQEATFTRPDGSDYTKIMPSLSPAKVNAIIENMADIYAYGHIEKDSDGMPHRILTVRSPDDSISCGCRFPYIDSNFEFSYNGLKNALVAAIERQENESGSDFITNDSIQPIAQNDYDFDAMMDEFNEIVDKIQSATGKDFGKKWAKKIQTIVSKYLGAGKKVSEATSQQAEQLDLILADLKEELANGL